MISGTGKAKRESAMLLMNVGTSAAKEWELLGRGIEDMSRSLNNEVEAVKDVTGVTDVNVVAGAQTTTVDPVKFERESKVSRILYDIYKYNKELDDVVYEFVEVFTEDKTGENEYAAFLQSGAVDLKSWGGDTKAVNSPFDINWKGQRIHGTFNALTKVFTPSTGAEYQITFSVSGTSNARLAGAQITVANQVLTADSTGIAALSVPAGSYPYTVSANGYATKSGTVSITTAAKFEAVSMTAA